MAEFSRTSVSISMGMGASIASLRDMIEKADRLGAPDDARVLTSGLTIEWEELKPSTCHPEPVVFRLVEAAVPGHESHRRPDGTMPPACAEAARRAAEDGQPNITVVNLDPDLVRRVCAETNLGTFQ